MAKILYKVGNWVYKRPKRVILFWLMIIAIAGCIIANYGINFKGDMSIPNTKSEKAGDVLKKAFNQTKEYGTIRLIFKVGEGKTLEDASVKDAINKTIEQVHNKDKDVKSIADPYKMRTISRNKKIAYADITYNVESDKVKQSSIDKVKESINITKDAGIQTELGGSVTLSKTEVGGTSEVVSIIAAFIILAFTLGSLLAAGLPIITALIGLVTGLLVIMAGTNVVNMSSLSISLASMVGLAVGIDYALFIISRYRQNLAEGYGLQEAAALAMGTAGGAVLFAGTTVIIALCGLSLVGVPFLGVMGRAAAVMVFIVVMVSLTAVPAVISLCGHHISPKKRPKASVNTKYKDKNKKSNFWGRLVTKHPIIMIAVVLVITISIAYSALDLELGLPDNGMMKKTSTERKGYDIMSEGFGEGINGSLAIVADASSAGTDSLKAIQNSVKEIKGLSDIASISPVIPTPGGKIAMITVIPKTGPNDKKTKELVENIRDKSESTEKKYNVKLMVTGRTAVNIDVSDKLSQAIPKFSVVVLGLALVLMILVFRSILVPIKAVVGFVMTLLATIGFDVLTLQKGNFSDLLGIPKAGPILCFIPIIAIGILFGLAMDYEVFLVSRMRENFSKTGNAKEAIVSGIKSSGVVVAAAGLIMAAVFASFGSQADINLKSMGIPLAFGVLFDAFVVRMTFVPAVMTLLGKSAWYMPKWLDKILPKFDIEGEALSKKEDAA